MTPSRLRTVRVGCRQNGAPRARRALRQGFTLVEVMATSSLTVFLAVVLSTAWVCLSRPTNELIAWSQLFQEMDLAVASIARDVGGASPDFREGGGGLGTKMQGRLLACKATNDANGYHLWLCYDGGANPDGIAVWDAPTDDTVIEYYIDPTTDRTSSHFQRLLRVNHAGGVATTYTVARYVQGMTITDEGSDALRIELDFQFVNYVPKGNVQPLSRQCALIVKKNP
ncbi:MAG: hypothetical protein LLG00_09975 [Planctomycetaceae bacterium]|nr:hypothetical protein [Planctomycetaceae bacterium]